MMLRIGLILFTIVTVSVIEATRCPPDMTPYNPDGTCLHYYHVPVSYYHAREFCQDSGGDLVDIKTAEKDLFISSELTDNSEDMFWHSANDDNEDSVFSYSNQATPLGDYKPWASRYVDGQDCATRQKSGTATAWHYQHCGYDFGFICENPGVSSGSHVTCDPGWVPNNEDKTCIKSVTKCNRTFDAARRYCRGLGAGLAASVVSKHSNRRGILWIGVHEPGKTGGFDNTEEPFESDPTLSWRRMMASTYPHHFLFLHHDVMMKKLRWYNKKCNRRFYFICEKPSL